MNPITRIILMLKLSLFTFGAWGYTPTLESLMRNGANPDLDGQTVLAEFSLERIEKELNDDGDGQSHDQHSQGMIVNEYQPHYFKMLFSNEQSRPRFVQVRYEGLSASDARMKSVDYIPGMGFSTMKFKAEEIEKKFFYSLMLSLVNNQSYMMVSLLKEMGIENVANREKVNEQQRYYLQSYINFLKRGDGEDPELANPLKPADTELAEKVDQVMKMPFLRPSKDMQRVKVGKKFFWQFEKEGLRAVYSHDNHRLLSLELKTEWGKLAVECDRYILFGKGMEFPEEIRLTDLSGAKYRVKMSKLTNFTDKGDNFMARIKRYRDKLPSDRKDTVNKVFTL